MFIVEMINDILQSIYVYLPQELLIVILACIVLCGLETIKSR